MIPNGMTFTRGERLTASKMNQLANLAQGQYSRTKPRPGGSMGFSGDLNWGNNGIVCEQPANKPRFKPFDIYSCYDVSGYLTSYVVQRPLWYDGETELTLDDVLITRTDSQDPNVTDKAAVAEIQNIYLCHCSAVNGEGEAVDLDMSAEWVVMDDITKDEDYPKASEDDPDVNISVVAYWKLYDVNKGLIKNDVRDAFVQVGGKGAETSTSVILDLSSLNWFNSEISVEVSGEVQVLSTEMSAQVWNYNTLSANDLVNIELSHSTDEMDEEELSVCIDKYRFLARPEDGGTLKYISLSVLSALSVDMSSVNYKKPSDESSTERKDINIVQAWNYDELDNDDKDDIDTLDETLTYRFLARPEEGGTLKYVSISGILSAMSSEISVVSSDLSVLSVVILSGMTDLSSFIRHPDADVVAAGLSSVQSRRIDDNLSVLQLYQFDNMVNTPPLSTDSLVVRRNNKYVDYISLMSLSSTLSSSISSIAQTIINKEISGIGGVPPDGDVQAAGLSSIQTRTIDGGSKVLELYNFHDPTKDTIGLDAQDRYEFVMRDNTNHCVKYVNLSGIGTTLSGTDNSSHTGSAFKFQSADDSNIIVNVNNGVITIGAYYL